MSASTRTRFLDDGSFWPTAFAVLEVTNEIEQRLRALVRKAAG
ncbi:hypothetical protein [Rhodococcus sp. NPDC003348]